MSDLIVCISCVKSKKDTASQAKDIYTSALFKGMYSYAKKLNPKSIFILSAMHGLLHPDQIIEPYEKTLNNMSADEQRAWARHVLIQLEMQTDIQVDKFIFLAGDKYRKHLLSYIPNHEIPMKGLKLGQQLQWLSTQ